MSDNKMLRNILLLAADEDFSLTKNTSSENIVFSSEYLQWEADFLASPNLTSRKHTKWKKYLQTAACIVLVLSMTFGAGIASGPQVKAAMAKWLDPSPPPTSTGMEVSVQLSGTSAGVFTSEKFACVDENGDTLRYWYQNTGDSLCSLQLFKVGTFGDKQLGEPIVIEPGDADYGTYENPNNDVFYLRVTCIDSSGGNIQGTLRADQYDMS